MWDAIPRPFLQRSRKCIVESVLSKVEVFQEGFTLLTVADFKTDTRKYKQLIQKGFGDKTIEIPKSWGDAWLDSPQRREFAKICFEPGGDVPVNHYNLWRGFAVEAKEGSWSILRGHVLDNICRGRVNDFHWLIAFDAKPRIKKRKAKNICFIGINVLKPYSE